MEERVEDDVSLRKAKENLEKKEQSTEDLQKSLKHWLEKKATLEEDIKRAKIEIESLKQEINELSLEGQMHQLASRNFDFPLKETWQNKHAESLVVDLARFSIILEKSLRNFAIEDSSTKLPGKQIPEEYKLALSNKSPNC